MEVFKTILLCFLVVCAVSVSLSKRLLTSIIIFMSYSTVMAVIWVILRSPDLAITEAAVGVGVTSGLTDEIRLGCEISIYAISASRINTRISHMAFSTRPTPPDFLFFFLAMVSAPSFS